MSTKWYELYEEMPQSQTNTQHPEEETQGSLATGRTQSKSTSSLFLGEMIAKLEGHYVKLCYKTRTKHKNIQPMGAMSNK